MTTTAPTQPVTAPVMEPVRTLLGQGNRIVPAGATVDSDQDSLEQPRRVARHAS
jgi:hypothetical protein